ncbi:MAG: Kazal-type serine protease inhibitor domain-containing protein [Myxococcota bacterium]
MSWRITCCLGLLLAMALVAPSCADESTAGPELGAVEAALTVEQAKALGAQLCGGPEGLTCGAGEFCRERMGSCGKAGWGVCRKAPKACPRHVKPVCGCNGKSYRNACEAAQAGASVAHSGRCEPVEPPIACGKHGSCPDGMICNAKGCGEIVTGICVAKPEICPDVYAPVCGCDGETYGNACESLAAGVRVGSDGQCAPPFCGGKAGYECPKGQVCINPAGTCDVVDNAGQCVTPPRGCTKEYAPVCGCDGVTYGNGCMATAAGVSIDRKGACCEPVLCELFCENGFATDENGCEICKCNPVSKCCDEAAFPLCLIGNAECCGDGSWACPNGATGESQCKAGPGKVCEGGCCDPAKAPVFTGTSGCKEGYACCPDGTWACSIGDAKTFPCGGELTQGPFGEVCPAEPGCCDGKTEPGAFGNPFCFEGHACCPDGTWACSIGDGKTFSCGGELTTGPFGGICEVEDTCCDKAEFPLCLIGNAECCGDGTWACPDGKTGASQCKVKGGEVCPVEGACCDKAKAPGVNGASGCKENYACCPDGTWACSIGDGKTFPCGGELTQGPFGEVCPVEPGCCDAKTEPGAFGNPICFEGHACCPDGSWSCSIGDGKTFSCGGELSTGPFGEACPVEAPCCDKAEFPLCLIGNAECCGDGSWACPNGATGASQCKVKGGAVCPATTK